MKVAFIVTLVMEEASGLNETAAEIADKLNADYIVDSVKPWNRKNEPTQKMSPRGQQMLTLLAAASAGRR